MPVRITRPLGGTAYLSCLAWLENPRVVDDVWGNVVFDVLVSSSVSINETDQIIGSLWYEPKDANEILTEGLYDIHAKVVTFQSNTHERSPIHADKDFAFMGDLLELRPVSDNIGYTACTSDHPARLFASGRVTEHDRNIYAFTFTVWQIVDQSSPVARVTVRGCLESMHLRTIPPTVFLPLTPLSPSQAT
ncbi:hypothetical protein EDB84DRAFT_1435790 [Lactarius hengduanensis]|nr:hypothetical protein EDB84DRAFT_1435790 [Lactarius hengduanensis]